MAGRLDLEGDATRRNFYSRRLVAGVHGVLPRRVLYEVAPLPEDGRVVAAVVAALAQPSDLTAGHAPPVAGSLRYPGTPRFVPWPSGMARPARTRRTRRRSRRRRTASSWRRLPFRRRESGRLHRRGTAASRRG